MQLCWIRTKFSSKPQNQFVSQNNSNPKNASLPRSLQYTSYLRDNNNIIIILFNILMSWNLFTIKTSLIKNAQYTQYKNALTTTFSTLYPIPVISLTPKIHCLILKDAFNFCICIQSTMLTRFLLQRTTPQIINTHIRVLLQLIIIQHKFLQYKQPTSL